MPIAAAIAGAGLGVSLAKHGTFNTIGLEDTIQRQQIERTINDDRIDEITSALERDGRFDLSTDEQKRFDRASRRGQNLSSGIERREGMLNFMQKNEYASPVFNRFRKSNAIGMGLAGGALMGFGGSVIGNEIERRRREEKIQERQERGY